MVNVSEIINAFSGCRQIIMYPEVEAILAPVSFRFASGGIGQQKDVRDKIEYLYNIGFVGILADTDLVTRFNLGSKHVFYYNEGTAPLRVLSQTKYKNLSFIIHPIFSEYLGLDTSGQELMLQFSWEYLHKMENVLFASPAAFVPV